MNAELETPELKERIKQQRAVGCAYVSVPFCRSLCAFCCWAARFGRDLFSLDTLKAPYLAAVEREIDARSHRDPQYLKYGVDLQVLHVGGGTPTLLSAGEVERLARKVLQAHDRDLDELVHFALEVRPDTVTEEQLAAYHRIGVNRLSLGVQSFDQRVLNGMGRHERAEDRHRVCEWSRSLPFEHVSYDLVFGFPFQSFDDFKGDLTAAIEHEPDHLDVSPWIPQQKLLKRLESYDLDGEAAKMMEWAAFACELLESAGYRNYYHKYFARPGKMSAMNLIAGYAVPTASFGAGGEHFHSYSLTSPNIREYIDDPVGTTRHSDYSDAGNMAPVLHALTRELLFPEGIDVARFNSRYACDLGEILAADAAWTQQWLASQQFAEMEDLRATVHRLAFLGTLRGWRERGDLEVDKDVVRIRPSARFSGDMYGLYTCRC